MSRVRVSTLSSRRDARGVSVAFGTRPFDFVPTPRDMHVATVVRDAVRGNHLHRDRSELLILRAEGPWMLRWDESEDGPVRECRFSGASVVMVEVDPGCSHAVVNLADTELVLVSISSGTYEAASGETVSREVYPAPQRETFHVEPPRDVNASDD